MNKQKILIVAIVTLIVLSIVAFKQSSQTTNTNLDIARVSTDDDEKTSVTPTPRRTPTPTPKKTPTPKVSTTPKTTPTVVITPTTPFIPTPSPTPTHVSYPSPTPPQDNTPTPNKEELVPTEKEVKPVITYKEETYTEYISVTDEDYRKDSDGDKIVDALDPDPFKSQFLFFTDTDTDGIPNAFDMFPGKNDYLYRGNLDDNHNGIIDSYE